MDARLGVAILMSGVLHYMVISHSFTYQFSRIELQTFPSSLELFVTSPATRKIIPKRKEVKPRQTPLPIQEIKEEDIVKPVEKIKIEETKEEIVETKEVSPQKSSEASVGSIKQGTLQAAVLEGQAPPTYPMLARVRKIEGEVLLKIEVLKNGTCGAIQIKKSSGYAILDSAALAGVRKWRFEPAQRDGKAIKSEVEVPIIFQLH